ncbi:MAG: DUF1499 domain-containing protein [Gammaproteobacteria bacterium]
MEQLENGPHGQRKSYRYITIAAFWLAVGSTMTAVLAGLGSRWGWWEFGAGFALLKWAVYAGIAVILLSLGALLLEYKAGRRRGLLWAGAGLVIALAVVLAPLNWVRIASQVPPIHDITTDTQNPPQFVAVLPLRKNARNPAQYGGPEVAALQAKAYPHIVPLLLSMPPDQAFQHALSAAREMGWYIVDENPSVGRIEATATTRWFGFKDDVVIRITPVEQGSRVDMRSVSRVGVSDVGTNARRITAYLKRLNKTAVSR